MKKLIVKIVAAAMAVVIPVAGGFRASAANAPESDKFSLRYYSGASSDALNLTQNCTIAASGKDYIRVTVTDFSLGQTGGYVQAVGTKFETTPKNFTSACTEHLVFVGSTIPKAGTSVVVEVSLKNYYGCGYFTASGVVKQ